jgi:hypothetical protein
MIRKRAAKRVQSRAVLFDGFNRFLGMGMDFGFRKFCLVELEFGLWKSFFSPVDLEFH